MTVQHVHVASAHWARDFGRVEARVHLVLDTSGGLQGRSLLVSVPARGTGRLRQRIEDEARRMANWLEAHQHSLREALAA